MLFQEVFVINRLIDLATTCRNGDKANVVLNEAVFLFSLVDVVGFPANNLDFFRDDHESHIEPLSNL